MATMLPIIASCAVCGTPLPASSTRRRVYCSGRCRIAALRRRRALAATCERLRPVGAEVDHAGPPTPAPVDEQIARAVMELQTVGGAFARLAGEARPSLAWRCAGVAASVRDSLSEFFPVEK